MILLLGGTKDARLLALALRNAFPGENLTATAVSAYGADLLRAQEGGQVLQGKMDAAALTRFIREKEVRVLLDATHPFAEGASREAEQAAGLTGIPYLRYERPPLDKVTGEGVYLVPDFLEAARVAAQFAGAIFLTIGTRHLGEFLAALPQGRKVVARVLPEAESISKCREVGLTPAEIVAIQGPLSCELNASLFAAYEAGVVVSKESGDLGGTPEKVQAARKLGIPIVLVSRPVKRPGLNTPLQVVAELQKIIT